MILTEDKTYTMSLETEDNSSDSVLTNKTVELEFSNKELFIKQQCAQRNDDDTDHFQDRIQGILKF